MVDGMVALMPNVKVGHIGLYRDPNTLEPVKYYFKMPPDIQERDAIIVDPMLATGGSAAAAAMFLKEVGVQAHKAHEHHRRSRGRGAHAGRAPGRGYLRRGAWTSASTTTATSSPVSATPATVSSARSKALPRLPRLAQKPRKAKGPRRGALFCVPPQFLRGGGSMFTTVVTSERELRAA